MGKIYRPVQHSHTHALSTHSGATASFRTTVSYLARIPRKFRPVLVAFLTFVFVAGMLFRWSADESGLGKKKEMQKRYARGLQKAFVINEYDQGIARHPSYHLNPDAVDQVKDSEVLEAFHAEDISNAAQDTQFIPVAAAGAAAAAAGGAVVQESEFKFTFRNEKEELAALVSFLTSSSSNALPPVDPQMGLDPQLVLEFDYTKEETARADMAQLAEDVWALFPVILVGQMRDPYHREVLKTMSHYTISPPPLVIEVDQRRDAGVLVPLLARLLGTTDIPQLIVNGEAAGGYKELTKLQEDGDLKTHISGMGIEIKDKKLKKKQKYAKDAERRENERILGPKPIMEPKANEGGLHYDW